MGFLKSFLIESVRILLPLAILAGGIGGLAVVVMNRQPPEPTPEMKHIPRVETIAVNAYDGELELEVDGLVVPYREVSVAAEVAGKVIYKDEQCKTGKLVRQGQFSTLAAATVGLGISPLMAAADLFPEHPWLGTLLVQVDPRDYQLEINRLKSELGQARANLQQNQVDINNSRLLIKLAQVQLDLQIENYADTRKLYQDGASSQSQLRTALNNKVVAENGLETLRAQLNVNEAKREALEQAVNNVEDRLEKAQLDLERTYIWAPLNGKVVQCDVEQGGFIQRGAQLAMLEDTSAAEVRCNLTTDEVGWLWQQTQTGPTYPTQDHRLPRARVKVVYTFLGQEFLWDGVLSHYDGPGLDKTTHTLPCRVLVSDPDNVSVSQEPPLQAGSPIPVISRPPRLLRNMYVKVRIYVQPRTPLLELSEQALKPGNLVWRVRDGKLNIVPVQVAQITNGRVLLAAEANDLQAGDRLILTPIAFATEGVKVQEINQP